MFLFNGDWTIRSSSTWSKKKHLAKRAMPNSKNNKGKPADSGTVSNARRKVQNGLRRERDKFLESSTNDR